MEDFLELIINFSDDRRGPFYANKNLFMYEYPSRLLFSPHAETRYNQFVTDNFGLRNETAANEANNYDIVVGGASNVWGSYLDQSEIISSRLEQLCDCSVYNYGSALNNKSRMFLDERFMNNPPKIFIIIAPDTQFASAFNGQWPILECSGVSLNRRSCQFDADPTFEVRSSSLLFRVL